MTTTPAPTDLDNLDELLEEYASAHVEYWTSEDDSPFEADAKKRREEAAAAIREQLANVEEELAKTRAELDGLKALLEQIGPITIKRGRETEHGPMHYGPELALLANPATTAEPAAVHTVWDHYGPCGYCGVTTGPCLNPDDTAPWPVERKVPAPKPHPSRQLAPEAEPADEPKATATDGWPKSQECSIGAHRPCDRDYCRCECHAEAAPEPAAS